MLVGRQLPIRARSLRIDATAQLAERSVGVDGHHTVVVTQLREHGSDAGGHGRLPDTALTHDADLVVAAQHRLDPRLQLGLPDVVGGWSEVD